MTRKSKILSRIDAAANIQVFLLEQRYFPTLSSSSISQNEAIVKDVLRLAEYIRSQCRLLQTTDFKHVDNYEVMEGTGTSPHSNSMIDDILPENQTKSVAVLSVDHKNETCTVASSKATEKSPGFDRLLNKILSPSKPAATELIEISATDLASQTVQAEDQRDYKLTERNYLAKALMSKSSPPSPSTVTTGRIPSYADQMYLHQSDSSSQCTSGLGMSDPNVSYVRNFAGENCSDDDDDDDVFDLLKSVDDWPALRTFFRGEIPSNDDILESSVECCRGDRIEIFDDNIDRHYVED